MSYIVKHTIDRYNIDGKLDFQTVKCIGASTRGEARSLLQEDFISFLIEPVGSSRSVTSCTNNLQPDLARGCIYYGDGSYTTHTFVVKPYEEEDDGYLV